MIVDIVMPKMGESITEGTILEWRKKTGDSVAKDEILLEIGTDKVDSEIPSPQSGVITEILSQVNDVVEVGIPIARMETDANAAVTTEARKEPTKAEKKPTEAFKPQQPVQPKKQDLPKSQPLREKTGKRFYTPVVLKIAAEKNLDMNVLESIPGSGRGGRVTKHDILSFLESMPAKKAAPVPSSVSVYTPPTASLSSRVVEMDHIRKRIAEHMRTSVDTAAHVYVTAEVDMTAIMEYIQKEGPAFKAKEGFSLTVTPFVLKAVISALQEFPEMNASVVGEEIHYHPNVNLGMAVAVDNGLMVPVIPRAEELNFLGLCRRVTDLAVRTRNKQISPDELQGSTFSVTNFGVFKVQMGTPIINQPNVGILGVGTITKRPVVIEANGNDLIGIRSMMILSLGFDHRLIDGAGGSRFINKVHQDLEGIDLEKLF